MTIELLKNGDVIEIKEGHSVYAEVKKSDVYENCKNSNELVESKVVVEGKHLWLKGEYLVKETMMKGGGAGHGFNDIYPDGHCVVCEKMDETKTKVSFYQTGSFTAMITDIKPLRNISLEEVERNRIIDMVASNQDLWDAINKRIESNKISFVKETDFGEDHWSLLMYIHSVCMETESLQVNIVISRDKKLGDWQDNLGTKLHNVINYDLSVEKQKAINEGAILKNHDDIDCLYDLEKNGMIEIIDIKNFTIKIKNKGLETANLINNFKIKGGKLEHFQK